MVKFIKLVESIRKDINERYFTREELLTPTDDGKKLVITDPDGTSRDFKEELEQIGTQEEKEKWFEERTLKHIDLVQKAVLKIVEKYPEFKDSIEQTSTHDASKFQEPEYTPYLDISWRHKFDNYKSYKKPGTLNKEAENQATLHHITTNSHHPEYWLEDKSKANINKNDRDKSDEVIDASKMSDLAIAEMIADWVGMDWELKHNGVVGLSTVRNWYNKQNNIRWKFSKEQNDLIDKLIKIFE